MIENLHNDEPIISAAEGWQQMHGLLNQYMPVQKTISLKKRWMSHAASILLFNIFLCISLQLDNNMMRNNLFFLPSSEPNTETAVKENIAVHSTLSSLDRNKIVAKKESKSNNSDLQLHAGEINPVQERDNSFASTGDPVQIITAADSNNETDSTEQTQTQKKEEPKARIEKKSTALACNADNPKKDKKLSWNLFAGMGANVNTGAGQNLQPYPVAEAKLNIGNRYYIALGISAFSPVAGSSEGISKTVYVNDPINNVSLFNERSNYNNLRYTDIPVLAGINIDKHLSVEAGLQASILMNKKTKKIADAYDYQMNSISLPVSSLLATTAASRQKDYPLETRNTDFRFVTGLRYTINKIAVSVNYQHGFQPTGKGNTTSTSNNQIIVFRILYQLK